MARLTHTVAPTCHAAILPQAASHARAASKPAGKSAAKGKKTAAKPAAKVRGTHGPTPPHASKGTALTPTPRCAAFDYTHTLPEMSTHPPMQTAQGPKATKFAAKSAGKSAASGKKTAAGKKTAVKVRAFQTLPSRTKIRGGRRSPTPTHIAATLLSYSHSHSTTLPPTQTAQATKPAARKPAAKPKAKKAAAKVSGVVLRQTWEVSWPCAA